jgi:hypothetical protein
MFSSKKAQPAGHRYFVKANVCERGKSFEYQAEQQRNVK